MVKGLKITLFAGVLALGAFAPVYAASPIISGLPDIKVGDVEDSSSTSGNVFVFADAFQFSAYVSDADTPVNTLKWSFAEYTNPDLAGPQYTVNGVAPILNGDAAIAQAQDNGNVAMLNPGANQINAGSDFATFRDILFSPTSGSAPYPDPSPADAAAAAEGKALRFYVSDLANVAYQDVLIRTVDGSDDSVEDSDGYQEIIRDSDFTSGWEKSGLVGPNVTATSATAGQLDINVTPDNMNLRIYGWVNFSMLPYDSVGADKFVRGKFYVNTTNDFSAPVNQVPAFRLRVFNERAVNAAVHFDYAQTGITDPGYEPYYASTNNEDLELRAGKWIRPSGNQSVPSLYRVNLDPVDTPGAAGTNIGALMESHVLNAPANGTLSLKEVVLATYDALEDSSGTLVFEYDRALGNAGGVGGTKAIQGGSLNTENWFVGGRRPNFYLPFEPGDAAFGPFGTITDAGMGANGGYVADTDAVSQNYLGLAIMNFAQASNTDKLRISPDKLYRARYYATSSVPTDSTDPAVESQANVRFRFQTGAGTLSYFLDIASICVRELGTPAANQLSREVLPGIGSANPEKNLALDTAGEAGGWYSVIVSSPLNSNGIRKDQDDNFFQFGLEPGPGNATEASGRNVTLGVDLLQQPSMLRTDESTEIPYARPNRGHVRLSAVKVYEYPEIDDGGYDYSGVASH